MAMRSDCIIKKAIGFEAEKFEKRHKAEIDGVGFWVISREDLILSKLEQYVERVEEKSPGQMCIL